MRKNILIIGQPKSGKSTLLRKLITNITPKVGFVTNEIKDTTERLGFDIETHLQHKKVLAHVDFTTPHKVSKYFVDIKNLEVLLPEVSSFGKDDLLYVDEIGQMQLFSDRFQDFVLKYLDSNNICLATVSAVFEDQFIKTIKERADIILVELSAENRDTKDAFITQLLKKIAMAKNYISEPQRFVRKGQIIELQSEHGIRNLLQTNKKWNCDCDFCKEYGICSHIIAVEEVVKNLSI